MKNKGKPRKKVVPGCYQTKKSASLSKLLKLATYKKRINDLVYKNRYLAVALQESRCENTSKNKLFTEIPDKILHAQGKIRDMVKTINTLVCDIDEVKKSLDFDWESMKEMLLQNRYTSDKKIAKATELEGIAETSISPLASEMTVEEDIPLSSQSSQQNVRHIALHESNDQEKIRDLNKTSFTNETDCIPNSNEAAQLSEEREIPTVLFVEESANHSDKNRRSSKSGSEKYNGSLTPELDIDFTYSRRKSSSRRQTLFRYSNCRKTKSNDRVASCEQAEEQTQNEISSTGSGIIQKSEVYRSPHIKSEGQCGNFVTSTDSSYICTTLASCANNDQVASLALPPLESMSSAPQPTEYNHTLLLNEDMELTEVLHPSCNPVALNCVLAADNLGNEQLAVPVTSLKDNKKEICKDENETIKGNLHEENSRISIPDKPENLNAEEITWQENITNTRKRSRKSLQMDSASPLPSFSSFCETDVNYAVVFSDSDSDWTPSETTKKRKRKNMKTSVSEVAFKISDVNQPIFFRDSSDLTPGKTVKKRKCKDREIDSAFSISGTVPRKSVAEDIEDCFSQQKGLFQNESSELDGSSVFNFNASISEKSDKHKEQKKSKLSRNKKSDKKQGVSAKPLTQSCDVTKLKSFDLKFTKSKHADKKNRPEDPKRSDIASSRKSCVPLSNVMEKEFCTVETSVNKEKFLSPDENSIKNKIDDNKCNSSLTDFGLFSPRTILKMRSFNDEGRKSEVKRVSFNVSDLVCNFTKTSVSKTIANNEKVWQTSKSVVDLEEILPPESPEKCRDMIHEDDRDMIHENDKDVVHDDDDRDMICGNDMPNENESDGCVNGESLSEYSGETEIYNFPCPTVTDAFSVFAEADVFSLPQKVVSTSSDLSNNKFSKKKADVSDKPGKPIKITNEISTTPQNKKEILYQKNVGKKVSSIDIKTSQPESMSSVLKIKNKSVQKKYCSSSKENMQKELKNHIIIKNEEHKSNKTDGHIKYINKNNIHPHSENDILSKKNEVKKEHSISNIHVKSTSSSALKIKSPLSRHSSSKENIPIKSNKTSNCRNSKILEMLSFNDNRLSNITADNRSPSSKDCEKFDQGDTVLEKKQSSKSVKQKKKRSQISIQSSPVSKNILNLDISVTLTPKTPLMKPVTQDCIEDVPSEPLRPRRSKPVSYKEPSLTKKLRRDF